MKTDSNKQTKKEPTIMMKVPKNLHKRIKIFAIQSETPVEDTTAMIIAAGLKANNIAL